MCFASNEVEEERWRWCSGNNEERKLKMFFFLEWGRVIFLYLRWEGGIFTLRNDEIVKAENKNYDC